MNIKEILAELERTVKVSERQEDEAYLHYTESEGRTSDSARARWERYRTREGYARGQADLLAYLRVLLNATKKEEEE